MAQPGAVQRHQLREDAPAPRDGGEGWASRGLDARTSDMREPAQGRIPAGSLELAGGPRAKMTGTR